MKKNYWNTFLGVVFLLIVAIVMSYGQYYKAERKNTLLQQQYTDLAQRADKKLQLLINEKGNATLTVALSMAENPDLRLAVLHKQKVRNLLQNISQELHDNTDFKNVWIQLIDEKGVVISRSYSDETDDNVAKVRFDTLTMTKNPKIQTSISVGKYDLSIKANVPYFDDGHNYRGSLEVITHFNSVAQKMENEGYETIVLVDKSYKKQLIHPFNKQFIGEYYVANMGASKVLCDYIASKGVEHFVSYTHNYSLKDGYLIAHFALFNDKEAPMAYFLMFKKTADLDTKYIQNEEISIDFLMMFIIIFSGIILFFFIERSNEQDDEQENIWRSVLLFSLFFIVTASAFHYFVHQYQKQERAEFLKAYNTNVKKDYDLIQNNYKAVAYAIFETSVDTPAVLELMHEAYGPHKDEARAKLLSMLQPTYENFKTYDIRQLHFHLRNNESFLRFHRPQKFGDNLTGIRATVEWVNSHQQPIEGFEEGRIYNGWRYVFPLAYEDAQGKKEHVGSVEISFSAHAFAQEFATINKAKAGFIISKKVVDTKVFTQEKNNYEKSIFKDFYCETAIKQQLERNFIYFDENLLSSKDREIADSKIFQGETFTIVTDDNELFTFLPLKNAVTKEVVGAIILQAHDDKLEKQEQLLGLILWSGIGLIFLLTLFMLRENQQKLKFLQLSLKTQNVLDTQDSIVIITNGEVIFDANKKFLEFFDFPSLEMFKREHKCVCELFLDREGYYSLKDVPQTYNWITYLETLTDKDYVVLMEDKLHIEHSFSIGYSRYKEHYYVITFSDISTTMQEHFRLEDKMLHDKLTGAYNREFFDLQVAKLQIESKKDGLFLAFIMFDIDHFKNINDTYGHGVGDDVLKELVFCINNSIRSNDSLVRWGGEEFVILLSVSSMEQAYKIAQNLRNIVENHHFEGIEKLTCSFGVAINMPSEPILNCMKRVDEALYSSKANGRNRVTKA